MKVCPGRPHAGYASEPDELLCCRVAMLGLDLDAIRRGAAATLDELAQRCRSCDVREACAVDLRRDPNNPVWEAYCPNSAVLNTLAAAWWLPQ